MAYQYGLGPVDSNNSQQPQQPFIPNQSGMMNYAPMPQGPLQQQQGPGFGTTGSYESLPDVVQRNIQMGAKGFASPTSSLYDAYLDKSLGKYNQFENQYGYGQV